jgi:hypothetical protein
MLCPHCGEETTPGRACGRCGKALPPKKEVEVEYKEFRVTELLDIRMTKNDGAARTAQKTATPPRRATEPLKALRRDERRGKKTSVIVVMTIIVVVLAAIAGLYFSGFLTGF